MSKKGQRYSILIFYFSPDFTFSNIKFDNSNQNLFHFQDFYPLNVSFVYTMPLLILRRKKVSDLQH